MDNFYGKKINIWMQLPGFDRDKPDCGAAEYLEKIGFIPHSINALLFHMDIVHLHRGMETEYRLFPDNCSYYASPRNTERDAQPWTNYNLRTLAHNLKKAGTGLYASIMGSTLNNKFHDEWIYGHPEIHFAYRTGEGGINALKRFKDGGWYEDFFADKLCEMLVDYELDGVQLADGFCPMPGSRHDGDFSTDMFSQFTDHTGVTVPDHIKTQLGDDSSEAKTARGDWIWNTAREEWIRFYAWRWSKFFEKVCARVHAVGKKVIILGLYCTDPFETLYCLGMDLKGVVEAGVDYIMPNLLPTSVYMFWGVPGVKTPYFFHRYMAIAPVTAAYVPDGHFFSMLSVHDTTEEYDVLHHAPCKFERDLYTMMMYQNIEPDGKMRPSMEGLMLCLGDGLSEYDWNWISERISKSASLKAYDSVSPTIMWSDRAHDAMLAAYIKTRRFTDHKFIYEIFKAGAPFGSIVRSEDINNVNINGPLFVPNLDLCSDEEIKTLVKYNKAVVCIAPAGYDPAKYGFVSAACFTDPDSKYPMQVLIKGYDFDESYIDELKQLLVKDDTPELEGNPEDAAEHSNVLYETLAFSKVSLGFIKLCAAVLKKISGDQNGIECDAPMAAYKTGDNKYRLYLYCVHEDQYSHAFVRTKQNIERVDIITSYPVLPPRFMNELNTGFSSGYGDELQEKHAFKVNAPPGGVTIVDVVFK